MNARDIIKRLVALEERCAELEGHVQTLQGASASADVAKGIDERLQSVEDWRKNQEKRLWERGNRRQ